MDEAMVPIMPGPCAGAGAAAGGVAGGGARAGGICIGARAGLAADVLTATEAEKYSGLGNSMAPAKPRSKDSYAMSAIQSSRH